MFSVTMPPEIPRLADDILDDSVVVAVGARKLATAIARRVYRSRVLASKEECLGQCGQSRSVARRLAGDFHAGSLVAAVRALRQTRTATSERRQSDRRLTLGREREIL
jgi:hypothetical protein